MEEIKRLKDLKTPEEKLEFLMDAFNSLQNEHIKLGTDFLSLEKTHEKVRKESFELIKKCQAAEMRCEELQHDKDVFRDALEHHLSEC